MKRTARISAIITTVFLVALTTIDASAQFRDRFDRFDKDDARRIGYRNGYQFGIREGRQDRRSRDRFDPKDSRAYKDGKYGYRDEYRHSGDYRDGFRNGFLAGYREGYNNMGGWGRRDDDWWDRDDDRRRRDRDDDWWRRNNRRDRRF
jgi:hypothetical protein